MYFKTQKNLFYIPASDNTLDKQINILTHLIQEKFRISAVLIENPLSKSDKIKITLSNDNNGGNALIKAIEYFQSINAEITSDPRFTITFESTKLDYALEVLKSLPTPLLTTPEDSFSSSSSSDESSENSLETSSNYSYDSGIISEELQDEVMREWEEIGSFARR